MSDQIPPPPDAQRPPNPRDAQPSPYVERSGTAEMPPPAAPPPVRATSGLAIASFVLSLVWLAGLGSVLAIVFATLGLRQINRSGGWRGGNGLAIAGLVIGILGVLGSALFWSGLALVGEGVQQAGTNLQRELTPKVTSVSAGQMVTLPPSEQQSGIDKVGVYSLTYPVPSPNAFTKPGKGQEFAVARVRVCAGVDGSQNGPDSLLFNLRFPAGTTVGPSIFEARRPDLSALGALGADACARGYVTFEIAKGSAPIAVEYQAGFLHSYRWKLPTGTT